MTEYQQIIDDIRTVLGGDADPSPQAIEALAAAYAGAVEETNARLKKCDALLHKGHRAEALQISEIEPRLTDVVGVLDVPEREVWAEYVRQFGLPTPPELLIEVAADINEAYNVQVPVEKLMRIHRLYALGRVPLNHRLDVMRKIAAVDRGNPIWNDDLRTFEKARHTQLQDEAAAATKANDIASIAAIERELRESTWLIPPTKTIIDRVVQSHTRMRAAQARLDLRDVERDLTAAYSALDPVQARVLRDRWNKLATIADLKSDDPLAELVAPALDWLAGEDKRTAEETEHEQSVAALTRGLDDGAPQLELERAYRVATQHGRHIPAVLEQRLAERFRYLSERETRRSRLIIAGMVVGVLAITGLTAAGIQYQMRSSALASHVAHLTEAIADGRLDEAEKYLTDVGQSAPFVLSDPQIQKLQAQLQASQANEQGRRAHWRQTLESARTENPGWESFAVLNENLNRARDLAKTSDELAAVKEAERRIQSQQSALQTAADKDFLEKVDGLKKQIGTLADEDDESNTRLQKDAETLGQTPHVTAELKTQLKPLVARLTGMQERQSRIRREANAMLRASEAVGNWATYRVALERYANDFPGTRRTADFDRVVRKETDAWNGIDAWDQLVLRWGAMDFASIRPQRAEPLLKEATELVDKYKDHPAAVDLSLAQNYLRHIGQRQDASGASIATKLYEPLNNPTVAGLFLIETSDGKKYYAQELPRSTQGNWDVRYLKSFDLKKGAKLIPEEKVIDRNPAPQSTFSRATTLLLDKLTPETWDQTFLTTISSLYDDKRMDPLLKLQLLSLFIEIARQGSLPLDTAFARPVELIANAQLDPAVNWLDPDDADGAKARTKAEDLLKRLDAIRTAAPAAAKVAADLKAGLNRPPHAWIAWLHRDGDGNWIATGSVRNRSTWEKSSGDLVVLDVPEKEGAARFIKVGKLQNRQFVISPDHPDALVEGRPLFLKPGP